MVYVLRFVLNICTCIFALYFLAVVLPFIFSNIKNFLQHFTRKDQFLFDFSYFKLSDNKKINTLIGLLGSIGCIFFIITFCGIGGSTTPGSLFEKNNYEDEFEGVLISANHPEERIDCIVTLSRNYGPRYIEKLALPYNKILYNGEEFESYDNNNVFNPNAESTVNLGGNWYDGCYIIQVFSQADKASYNHLEEVYITDTGDCCASRDSNIYHFSNIKGWNCPYVKKIKPENLIQFHNEIEADFMGFEFCELCKDNY